MGVRGWGGGVRTPAQECPQQGSLGYHDGYDYTHMGGPNEMLSPVYTVRKSFSLKVPKMYTTFKPKTFVRVSCSLI